MKYLTLLLFIVFFLPPAYAAENLAGNKDFETAVKYFKNKNYKKSLSYFKKAKANGLNSDSLYYNLGVHYSKLGMYQKAKTQFEHLAKRKNFQQVAYYNLGRIAEKQQQEKAAINWYKKASTTGTDKKITRLSRQQLNRLQNTGNTVEYAHLSLAFGADDNITNAASNSPTNKSDSYKEVFAMVVTPINNNMHFKGKLLWLDYNTANTEDFMFYSVGVDYTLRKKQWKIVPEVSLLQSTFNQSSYQSILDMKVRGKRKLSKTDTLILRYRFSNIQSLNTLYDYLQGTRHQFRADYKIQKPNSKWRLRYQLELNNRQNTNVANYSPLRHNFRVKHTHPLNNAWEMTEEIGYRISQYGAASNGTRNDKRLRLRVAASKKLANGWHAGVHYVYTNNDSNLNAEDYTRNNIQIFANLDF